MDLNTIKVDTGLKDLKSKLSLVNSEMKANMSAFDRSDQSIGKYQTRLDGLNKKLEVQREVTDKAKKSYEKMVAEHGEGSVEAEKAARSFNEESAKLNNLSRYVENATAELAKMKEQQRIAGSGWTKIGDSMTKFGTGLKSISAKTRDVGRSLTSKITKPALGAATALGGIALAKGFGRLVGIDNAKAKLKGLGHDANNVQKIMDSALESVKGTSYGMDEAATTAASAVAAGIKPGKELTKYLSLTGDAAAIAGTSMSEMGSIINQVQTSQVAYTDNLNQLADRGIPIYQWLGEEAGVAAGDVKKMASEGSISSEMFLSAIEKNIGGAAKKMGQESFTAGLANMWSAVGRLGASFLDAGGKGGGFFSKLKPLIADFTDRIDDMGAYAEKAGEKFGEAFTSIVEKVKSIKAAYDGLSPAIQNIVKKIALVGSVMAISLGPILTGLGLFGGFVAKISTGLGTLASGIAKFGGLAKVLGSVFTALTSPIGITVGIIAALTAGFVIAYKKSETFRDIVNGLKDAFLNAVTGIKEFLTTNKVILSVVDQLKKNFEITKTVVSATIGAIAGFFKEKIGEMKTFWDENGEQILQAFRNIFMAIKAVTVPVFKLIGLVIETTLKVVLAIVKAVLPVIKGIFSVTFKLILAIVKSVWDNIKGVIEGGLKVITGIVQVFSGLFTGDFKKMWSGIKDIFFGALQFIWNYVQLMFWGKMLKGIGALVKSMTGLFKSMWNGIKTVFSTVIKWIVDFVKNRFTSMKNTTTGIMKKIYSFISSIWGKIHKFLKDIVLKIFNAVKNAWKSVYDSTKTRFQNVYNFTKNIFTKVKDFIAGAVKKVRDGVSNAWGKVLDKTKSVFKAVYDTVKKRFGDVVQAAKDLPGRIGKGISQFAHKVGSGINDLKKTMIKKLKGALNGVINGINWVLDKLHVKNIPTWKPKGYARGTDNHEGGPAYVGDGTGSLRGPELINTPDGRYYLSPAKKTLVNLPAGTRVLNAKLTKQLIPHYAKGKGLWDDVLNAGKKAGSGIKKGATATKDFAVDTGKKAVSGTKKAAKAVKDWTGDVWDYVKNPKKLLNIALAKVGVKMPKGGNFVGDVVKGGFVKVKNSAVGYIKKQFKKLQETFGGSGPVPKISGGAAAWKGMIKKAAAVMNEKISNFELNGIIAQIQRESGGNQKIVQSSSVYDINIARGNPARGLLQYIPQTFRKYAVKGHGNIYNGYDQLLAFFNNKNWRKDLPYGKRGWGPTGARKFASGGLIKASGLYRLAEEGWPEWVIPTDPSRRTDAMKLLALAGKDIERNSNKRPHQLPSIGTNDSQQDNSRLEKMVELLSEQVMLLTQLVAKDQNVYIDGKQAGKLLEPHISQTQEKRQISKLRARGIQTT